MADHRMLAGTLPWYAAGTLPEAERLQVEEHLAGCQECRDNLRQIRRLAELGAEASVDQALEHVAPGLLLEYADDRGALDAETVAFVESRLADCSTCRDAYANLQAVDAAIADATIAEAAQREAGQRKERAPAVKSDPSLFWSWLSATFLRPAPALAYLLIAAVGLPLLWTMRATVDPVAAVQVVGVSGQRIQREQGEQGVKGYDGPEAAPLDIRLDEARSPVLIELLTDLNAEDLRAGAMAFTVEVSSGGRTVWSRPQDPAAFVLRDGRGVLPLILDPGALGLGRDLQLAIRVDRPGDPLHGQALFVQRLRFHGK